MSPLRFLLSFSLQRHMEAKNVPVVDEKLFSKEFHHPYSKSGCTKDLQQSVYDIQIERVYSSICFMHHAGFHTQGQTGNHEIGKSNNEKHEHCQFRDDKNVNGIFLL